MRAIRVATMMAALLPLAACGGGGGVASTGPPTPVPTPSPSPSPTYTRIQDLSGNQTFVTASTSVVYDSQGVARQNATSGYPFGAGANSSAVTLKYFTSSDSYVVEGYSTSATFTQADLVASGDPKTVVLQKISGGTVTDVLRQTTPSPGGVDLSYVRFGSWMTTHDMTGDPALGGQKRLTYIMAGVPTIASDVPTTGTASFTATSVIGLATDTTNGAGFGTGYDLSGSTATLSADFAANTVQTSLKLSGIPIGGGASRDFGTFTGSGTIGNSSPTVLYRNIFSGTLTTAGPGDAGFSGSFFGPQASEFAYVWTVFQNGLSAEGIVAGKR